MTLDLDAVGERLAELVEQAESMNASSAGIGFESCHDHRRAAAWIGLAETALKSLLPSGHPLLLQWQSIQALAHENPSSGGQSNWAIFDQFCGVVDAALALVRTNRLSSIVDEIRLETVGEVLEQAEELLAANQLVAATVLAGGALETHLRHLCLRNQVTWNGAGSISAYSDAIARARKRGILIYSKTDGKQVTSWGGIRNDAAHDPTRYDRTKDEVRLMIEGIRQFLARNP